MNINHLKAEFVYSPSTGAITRKTDGGRAFATVVSGGYLNGKWNGKCYKAHRVAWMLHFGAEPDVIDHINGNPADNRLENLRSVTLSDNQHNRKLSKNNRSGFLGVCWHARSGKWRAAGWVDGRHRTIGQFSALEDAIAARTSFNTIHAYHENHGRISKVEAG
jgi:hypothetical protein